MRQKLLAPLALAAFMVAGAAVTPASALTITPTFGTGITTGAQTTINTAIAFYEGMFSDPITVPIRFDNMASGLGQSTTWLAIPSYSAYYTALAADATTANDTTALANTPGGSTNPVDGGSYIVMKRATARAVGLSGYNPQAGLPCDTGAVLDGCIGLNLSISNYPGHTGTYSLLATVEHEIDEVLGLGSSLPHETVYGPSAEDLFRWSGTGTRNYSTYTCGTQPAAYFSIDGGATPLDYFNNCDDGADYGDWITHTPSQVQDGITNGSGSPFLTATSPETTALDVIGYTPATQAPVPEPTTMVLFGTGLVGVIRRRRGTRR